MEPLILNVLNDPEIRDIFKSAIEDSISNEGISTHSIKCKPHGRITSTVNECRSASNPVKQNVSSTNVQKPIDLSRAPVVSPFGLNHKWRTVKKKKSPFPQHYVSVIAPYAWPEPEEKPKIEVSVERSKSLESNMKKNDDETNKVDINVVNKTNDDYDDISINEQPGNINQSNISSSPVLKIRPSSSASMATPANPLALSQQDAHKSNSRRKNSHQPLNSPNRPILGSELLSPRRVVPASCSRSASPLLEHIVAYNDTLGHLPADEAAKHRVPTSHSDNNATTLQSQQQNSNNGRFFTLNPHSTQGTNQICSLQSVQVHKDGTFDFAGHKNLTMLPHAASQPPTVPHGPYLSSRSQPREYSPYRQTEDDLELASKRLRSPPQLDVVEMSPTGENYPPMTERQLWSIERLRHRVQQATVKRLQSARSQRKTGNANSRQSNFRSPARVWSKACELDARSSRKFFALNDQEKNKGELDDQNEFEDNDKAADTKHDYEDDKPVQIFYKSSKRDAEIDPKDLVSNSIGGAAANAEPGGSNLSPPQRHSHRQVEFYREEDDYSQGERNNKQHDHFNHHQQHYSPSNIMISQSPSMKSVNILNNSAQNSYHDYDLLHSFDQRNRGNNNKFIEVSISKSEPNEKIQNYSGAYDPVSHTNRIFLNNEVNSASKLGSNLIFNEDNCNEDSLLEEGVGISTPCFPTAATIIHNTSLNNGDEEQIVSSDIRYKHINQPTNNKEIQHWHSILINHDHASPRSLHNSHSSFTPYPTITYQQQPMNNDELKNSMATVKARSPPLHSVLAYNPKDNFKSKSLSCKPHSPANIQNKNNININNKKSTHISSNLNYHTTAQNNNGLLNEDSAFNQQSSFNKASTPLRPQMPFINNSPRFAMGDASPVVSVASYEAVSRPSSPPVPTVFVDASSFHPQIGPSGTTSIHNQHSISPQKTINVQKHVPTLRESIEALRLRYGSHSSSLKADRISPSVSNQGDTCIHITKDHSNVEILHTPRSVAVHNDHSPNLTYGNHNNHQIQQSQQNRIKGFDDSINVEVVNRYLGSRPSSSNNTANIDTFQYKSPSDAQNHKHMVTVHVNNKGKEHYGQDGIARKSPPRLC